MPGVDPEKWIDEQVERERYAKLPLLLKDYGIAGQTGRDFMELAMCLAVEFVEGFKLVEPARKPFRAPGLRTAAAGAQFVAEMEALKEAEGLNTADAIRLIWKIDRARYGKMKERSLRKRYDEARKRSGQQ